MSISRLSRGKQRRSTLDVFTDRVELITAFKRNLEQKNPSRHRVLVFYGDGGIGKSTLLRKLEQLHRERFPSALMGRFDLAGADTTPPDLLLFRLRCQFPSIPFPSFSLALAEYGRRFRPEQIYGNDRKELLQWAGPYADVLAEGLSVLAKLSGVPLAVSAMKAAATAQRQVSSWIQQRAEPLLQRSQSLSEEQLLAELPLQWAKDFRQALSSHPGEDWNEATSISQDWRDVITYSGPPPLIVLDTYETLWHPGMGRSGRRREPREQWLVDLVSELPEVLWLIGGRDQLSWEEGYDRGWSEVCEQHLVGQLSDEDARLFLAKRGINEPAIVDKIVSEAAGVPFYLELETQLYDKTPSEERTPEVFGGSHQTLIDRLLTHLDPSERATLKLLAAFGIWDHKLFRQAVSHFATGYPATDAAELGRFWSIEPIGEGRWQLHNEMVHHLQANERVKNIANYEAVHRWGFAYFDDPLEGLEAKNIQAEHAERLQRALVHARKIQPAAEWTAWLDKRLIDLEKGTIWQPLLAVTERGVQQAEQELGGSDPAVASLLNRQATLLQQIARYEEAEPLFRRALEIDEASYGPDHPEVAMLLSNLATLLQATNRLQEAEQLMRRALEIYRASYGSDDPNVATVLSNLATLLEATNRQAEAEPLMRKALAIDEASYGPDHPIVAIRLNNLAQLLKATNRLEEAEQLMRRALAVDEASAGPDHPNVATALSNLATLLADTNLLEEAEQLMRRALAIDEASYGPDHLSVARDLSNLAMVLSHTNRLVMAEELMRRALEIDKASYGPDHPNVARDLSNLAMVLLTTNRLAESEQLTRRALAIDEASCGPDHPNVARDLSNLARLLRDSSRPAEAEPLMRRAIAIDEASNSLDHPNLAIRLDILSRILLDLGLHDEAETHARKALSIDEGCYGSDHPCTAFDLNSLAMILKTTDRLSESEELMLRSLDILKKFNSNGHEHPKWKRYLEDYRSILIAQGFSSAEADAKLHALYPCGNG
jgi:tetratricopeptide (TPR) repeat protein